MTAAPSESLNIRARKSHLILKSKDKRPVGDLWADRSGGACLFAWVENRNYAEIDRVVKG